MNVKKYIIPFIIIVVIGLLTSLFIDQSKLNGATLEKRELRLRETGNLGAAANIGREIVIDGYIISGYTAENNQHGLAVFAPEGKGKYRFQTNVNRQNGELICLTASINEKLYNFFWANRRDLDYAEVIYTIGGKTGQTIKLDAKNNKIIYTEAPSSDFSVEYYFVGKDGKVYK